MNYSEITQHIQVVIAEGTAVGLNKAEFFNAQTLQQHKDVVFEMIRRDKNNPSVIYLTE